MTTNGDGAVVADSVLTARPNVWLGRVHRVSGVALLVYLTALIVGTHLPRPEEFLSIEGNDKWLHFGAYFGLAVLMTTRCSAFRLVTTSTLIAIWSLIALTGAVDELTQMIPAINRHADIWDWVADVVGGACGLLAWKLLAVVLGRR